MVYKEEKVNKEVPDGSLQVELAISKSCAPSKSSLLCWGCRTDNLVEAQHILPAGFLVAQRLHLPEQQKVHSPGFCC